MLPEGENLDKTLLKFLCLVKKYIPLLWKFKSHYSKGTFCMFNKTERLRQVYLSDPFVTLIFQPFYFENFVGETWQKKG